MDVCTIVVSELFDISKVYSMVLFASVHLSSKSLGSKAILAIETCINR